MKVLVCGGRTYQNKHAVEHELDMLYHQLAPGEEFLVMTGGARGADAFAAEWCVARGARYDEYPARWREEGQLAGPLRNARMLRVGKPDLVIAFPGGRGTADMVRRAREAGVKVVEIAS